jgi:DNA-binding NtrC family response regulator
LTPDAFRALLQYSWPGNVRQLNNVCLTLVTHAAPGSQIDVSDIQQLCPEVLLGPKNAHPEAYLQDGSASFSDAIRAFRGKLVRERLQLHDGSVSAAARSLALSRPTFYRYLSEARRRPKPQPPS